MPPAHKMLPGFLGLFVLTAVLACQPTRATILYQTGWEHGSDVRDQGNPLGALSEGPTDQHASGVLASSGCFDGDQCLQIDWDRHAYSLRNGSYRWQPSGLGDGSHYLQTSEGNDPQISEPGYVKIGDNLGTEGVVGNLNVDEWAYDDANSLGYDTIYVRLAGDADPDSQSVDYIDTGRDGQLFTYDPDSYTASEYYVQTPNFMSNHHDYYLGFAVKFSSSQPVFVPVGRKMIYRTGGDNQSLLFFGYKDYMATCGGNEMTGGFYFKTTYGVDANSNLSDGEKMFLGGPKCNTTFGQPCQNWPGAESPTHDQLTADDQWHTVSAHVVESLTEGRLTLWVDGHLVIDAHKDAWNDTAGLPGGPCVASIFDNHHSDFSGFKFPTYFNLGPYLTDQTEYWDNFIVATTHEEVSDYLSLSDATPPSIPTGLTVN